MTERTTLSYLKFVSMMLLCALALTFDYRLVTGEGDDDNDDGSSSSGRANKLQFGMSLVLVLLGMFCVVLSMVNYFQAIYNYQRERIQTYNTEITSFAIGFLIIILLTINIILICSD
ncbi:unnamed protein product [Ambrosiozyma monospora]|uniref:Unnamed protein product n=1 Tax=Ambrosiozyma monospora TaxID=43982 RepID=A0ACB5TES4_AMBMO|nr:unnamed protein product [Ambrosiozyma monospora]